MREDVGKCEIACIKTAEQEGCSCVAMRGAKTSRSILRPHGRVAYAIPIRIAASTCDKYLVGTLVEVKDPKEWLTRTTESALSTWLVYLPLRGSSARPAIISAWAEARLRYPDTLGCKSVLANIRERK